jgi:hypothetical protein
MPPLRLIVRVLSRGFMGVTSHKVQHVSSAISRMRDCKPVDLTAG